jgi:hypothetical protein
MAEVVREEDGGEPAAAPLVFAYYVTGHGLGHATRVVEVRIGIEDGALLWLFCVQGGAGADEGFPFSIMCTSGVLVDGVRLLVDGVLATGDGTQHHVALVTHLILTASASSTSV